MGRVSQRHELFGEARREQADAEIVTLTLTGGAGLGARSYGLRIGDLGRSRRCSTPSNAGSVAQRLRQQFLAPRCVRNELIRGPAIRRMRSTDFRRAEAGGPRTLSYRKPPLPAYLEEHGIDLVGARACRDHARAQRSRGRCSARAARPEAAELMKLYHVAAPARQPAPRLTRP